MGRFRASLEALDNLTRPTGRLREFVRSRWRVTQCLSKAGARAKKKEVHDGCGVGGGDHWRRVGLWKVSCWPTRLDRRLWQAADDRHI